MIKDGTAVVAEGLGRVLINNDIRTLVTDPIRGIAAFSINEDPFVGLARRYFDGTEGKMNDRRVWLLPLRDDWTLAVDQATGIGVRWWGEELEFRIDQIEVNPVLPDGSFEWSGNVNPAARPGTAWVSAPDERAPNVFSAHLEVDLAGRMVYAEEGPQVTTLDEALGWARGRAKRVRLRTDDGSEYSAGDEAVPDLAPWPTGI